MSSTIDNYTVSRHQCSVMSLAALMVVSSLLLPAAGQSLDMPMPRTATNAAIHYQRAILFLSAVDSAKRETLLKPIWEIVTPTSTEADLAEVDELLIESRHAIRSALVGTNQTEANFGLDIRQYMIASYLPHIHPMTDLGRLLALHGMQRQSTGDWQAAARIYLSILRMGRQLNRQTTLAEALAGVEILETGYFALGQWATRCPDATLIEETFHIINAMSVDMVNPARTLRSEASISKMRLDAMQDAFPDGAWAEMVLESLGAKFPMADHAGMRKAAIEAASNFGVPREAFDDKQSFGRYMRNLRSIYVELSKESANCLTLSPPESIQQGKAVFAKYADKLLPTERASSLNPAKTAGYFAVHQAELDLLRLVLAISAARTSDGFPADLSGITGRFGGQLPSSPYDGGDYNYEVLEGGKGFSIKVSKGRISDIELPEIDFRYLPGEPSQ